jgi:hypothetical protein
MAPRLHAAGSLLNEGVDSMVRRTIRRPIQFRSFTRRADHVNDERNPERGIPRRDDGPVF